MARAKMTKTVTVKVAKSFDGLVTGQTFEAVVSERLHALISGSFLEVTDYGTSADRQGADDAGDPGGGATGGEAAGTAGTEPGEDSGAG